MVEKYPNANPLKNHALMLRVHKDVTVEREETQLVRTLKNKSKINKKLVYIYKYFYILILITAKQFTHITRFHVFGWNTKQLIYHSIITESNGIVLLYIITTNTSHRL